MLLLFVFSNFAAAQEKPNDLRIFDSISDYNCEFLLNRLDYFTLELGKNPNSKGFVVIYGGDDPIRNKFLERYIYGYLNSKKIDKTRFVIVPTKANPTPKVEFLISQSGNEKPNVTEEPFSFVLTKSGKPLIFVRETVEVAKINGEWRYFGGDCVVCCIESYYSDFLAEYLKANPQLNAHITISGKSKDHKEKLASLIREELVRLYEISSNRFLIKYVGFDQGIVNLSKSPVTLEIDFVSQK